MESFSLETVPREGVFLLRVQGYIDPDDCPKLRAAVEKGFAEGFSFFVLNFTESPVINSMCMAEILEITEIILDRRKGKIAFVGLSKLAKDFFQMAGLFSRVRLHPDEDLAVAGIRSA
jgi:anti-anti-sigma factor